MGTAPARGLGFSHFVATGNEADVDVADCIGWMREAATEIMLHVHHRGVGVCGVYTYEVAETKVTQTIDFARRHQHPLQCTMEKE